MTVLDVLETLKSQGRKIDEIALTFDPQENYGVVGAVYWTHEVDKYKRYLNVRVRCYKFKEEDTLAYGKINKVIICLNKLSYRIHECWYKLLGCDKER